MIEPIGVPDHIMSRSMIGHTWGYGNNLAVFPTLYGAPTVTTAVGNLDKPPKRAYEIVWETTLYNVNVRKLVNESSSTFVAIQNACQGGNLGNEMKPGDLLKFSHQYRCIMNACIEDLNRAADQTTNNAETYSQELQHLSEIFYKAELVWNLCEIMYLEKPVAILPGLMEWVRIHFPGPIDMTADILASSSPATHENYWNAVYGLVLQLQLDAAIKLLRTHPDFLTDAFQSACELIRKMPIFGINASISVPEFTFRWNHWKDECEARLEAGDFYQSKELELLTEILCGKEEIFNELASSFETWYQKMISQLMFTVPTLGATALSDEAERFLTKFQNHADVTPLDIVLLAVLRRDTRKMIGEMQTVLDNTWFTAHLADVLYHAGILESFEDANSLQLRENLLRDYALCLFSHQSLWTVGVVYLDNCPTVGAATLEQLLPRLSLESEYKANKILALAEKRQMSSVSTSICRVMGQRALANERLGAAVSWAVRAQDAPLATYSADAVLKKYLQDSEFTSTDLLNSLGAGLLASDRLAFLGKYHEFHRLYSKNDFRSAAALLISLISSRIAPKYFWTVLLMDALPLLETNPPVFTADQTYELMQSLQELTGSFQKDDENSPHPDCELNTDKTMLITLALSRNLAKCFVQQSVL